MFRSTELRSVERAGIELPLLGLGTVPLGGWPNAISDELAFECMQGSWDAGIRFFDTAPMYGLGMAEERVGRFLQTKLRDEYQISTKVGRLLTDSVAGTGQDDFWRGAPARNWHFDFSYDGVMRSVEDSIRRTGIDSFDLLLIHDPDEHYEDALKGALPALDRLRSDGTVKAIGAGMNQPKLLARFVEHGAMDIVLIAGRYTILDHSALDELFPVCQRHGTTVLCGGVFNSGILSKPGIGSTFDYQVVDGTWRENASQAGIRALKDYETGPYWLARALRIKAICDHYAVPLPAAALQFSAAHPVVSSLVVGAGSASRMQQNAFHLELQIPSELWVDLKAQELISSHAPVPG